MSIFALEPLNRGQLQSYLELANQFLDDRGHVITPKHFQKALTHRSVGLLFFEPSTRTRVSFELAAKRLGATTIRLEAQGSSITKGESVLDTCLNLQAMGMDAFVVRDRQTQTPQVLMAHLDVPIINAGNGTGEHPSQGLLDALTVCRHFSSGGPLQCDLSGRTIAIMGDIRHSRVARSDVHVFEKLGARVLLAGPSALLPNEDGWGDAQHVHTRQEALAEADVVIVLRIQKERLSDVEVDPDTYIEHWQLHQEHLSLMLPHAMVMHPGPVIRGVELDDAVTDGPRSLIMQQVRCGVAVRQALLHACLSD